MDHLAAVGDLRPPGRGVRGRELRRIVSLLLRLYRGDDEDDPPLSDRADRRHRRRDVVRAVAERDAARVLLDCRSLVDLGTGPYLTVHRRSPRCAALWKSRNWLAERPVRPLFLRAGGAARSASVSEGDAPSWAASSARRSGDALGLACEGLSRRRQSRMFPDLDGYKLLPFGKGLCSDDTEHTCMLAQSLIETAHFRDPDGMAQKAGGEFRLAAALLAAGAARRRRVRDAARDPQAVDRRSGALRAACIRRATRPRCAAR